jgi:hypothetical protein
MNFTGVEVSKTPGGGFKARIFTEEFERSSGRGSDSVLGGGFLLQRLIRFLCRVKRIINT